jgi:hypothetical protein
MILRVSEKGSKLAIIFDANYTEVWRRSREYKNKVFYFNSLKFYVTEVASINSRFTLIGLLWSTVYRPLAYMCQGRSIYWRRIYCMQFDV